MQKKKSKISRGEFNLWFVFWVLAGLAVVFIKQIDQAVAGMGFSGSGIEVLFYLGVVLLFYFVFRLRLRQERQEREITKLVREISLFKK